MSVADVQLEKGYTPIANELLEAVYRLKLNGTQFKIIMLIWRYTYGFKRIEHEMSVNFIARGINSSERMVKKGVTELVKNRILLEIAHPNGNHSRVLRFNKNYDEWGNDFRGIDGNNCSPGNDLSREQSFPKGVNNPSLRGGTIIPQEGEQLFTQENKNLNKNINKNLKKGESPLLTADPSLQELLSYYEQKIGMYSTTTARELINWREDADDSLIRYAIDEAEKNNKKHWGYIRAILQNKSQAGITKAEQLRRKPKDTQPEAFQANQMTNAELERLALEKLGVQL